MPSSTINELRIDILCQQFRKQLESIVTWWSTVAVDQVNGGFVGEVDGNDQPRADADKGIILNARVLWFFSEAAIYLDDSQVRLNADRAYDYLTQYFIDKDYGGVYWQLDRRGRVVDNRKKTYALAFAIYGLSSYYKLTKNPDALRLAMEQFDTIEKHCHDDHFGGYVEAHSCRWERLDDMRLGDNDANLPKSQNAHLHILEAYTNLFSISQNSRVESSLRRCLDYFDQHIIDKITWHLRLFMDERWRDHSTTWSFGHDIECSWLLSKAGHALGEENANVDHTVIQLAEACLDQGFTASGKVLDDYNFRDKHANSESCWWVQAEASVGFLNAYRVSGQFKYLSAFESVWAHIQREHIDTVNGEWHWLGLSDQSRAEPHYKAGFWKAPYHNGRAMMECEKLLKAISAKR